MFQQIFKGGAVAVLVGAGGVANAQPTEADFTNADAYDFDLFTPSGPALTANGLSGRRMSAPGVQKEFSFETGQGQFAEGDTLGAALSISPYWLGARRQTLGEYQQQTDRLTRLVARSSVSAGIASTALEGGGDRYRLAAAVQTELLDAQDHRLDDEAYACLADAWARLQQGQQQSVVQDLALAFAEDEDADLDAIAEEGLSNIDSDAFAAARQSCRNAGMARQMGKPSWIVGGGVGWRSELDEFGGWTGDGVSVWTQLRQPLSRKGRTAAFVFGRADLGQQTNFAAGSGKSDLLEVGGGLALQSTRVRLEGAASFNQRTFDDQGPQTPQDDEYTRYVANLDIKLRDGLWLAAYGGVNEGSDLSDGGFGGARLLVSWRRVLRDL